MSTLLDIQSIVATADSEVMKLQALYTQQLQSIPVQMTSLLSLQQDQYGKFKKIVRSTRFINGVVKSMSPALLEGVKGLLTRSANVSIGQLAMLPNARDIMALSPLAAEKVVEANYVSLLGNMKDVTKSMSSALRREIASQFISPKSLDVSQQLVKALGNKTVAQARTVMHTALASTQRDVQSVALDSMSGTAKQRWVLYMGPDDNLTRPFCDVLTGYAIKQADINKLNNNQKGARDIQSFCGGWNCRHQLVPVTASFIKRRKLKRATPSVINKANSAARGE